MSIQTVWAYGRLMRLDRPIGFLLLLWPTLWGLWCANNFQVPAFKILFVFIFGVIIMRSAGCVVNDIADRHLDAHVKRTQQRPLACGALSVKAALILFLLLCMTALSLVLMLNREAIAWAGMGLIIAIIYPFAKRYFSVPQCFLGLAFSWGIPVGFAAISGHVPAVAWLLWVANFFWIMAYDTQYAMMDREDDLKMAVHSSAIFFGRFVLAWIVVFQALMLLLLVCAGMVLNLHGIYFLALASTVGFFFYQYGFMRQEVYTAYQRAFLNNAWVGAVIFLGLVSSRVTF